MASSRSISTCREWRGVHQRVIHTCRLSNQVMWLILNMGGGGGGAAVNMLSCYTGTIIIRHRHKRLILKVGGAAVATVTNCTCIC